MAVYGSSPKTPTAIQGLTDYIANNRLAAEEKARLQKQADVSPFDLAVRGLDEGVGLYTDYNTAAAERALRDSLLASQQAGTPLTQDQLKQTLLNQKANTTFLDQKRLADTYKNVDRTRADEFTQALLNRTASLEPSRAALSDLAGMNSALRRDGRDLTDLERAEVATKEANVLSNITNDAAASPEVRAAMDEMLSGYNASTATPGQLAMYKEQVGQLIRAENPNLSAAAINALTNKALQVGGYNALAKQAGYNKQVTEGARQAGITAQIERATENANYKKAQAQGEGNNFLGNIVLSQFGIDSAKATEDQRKDSQAFVDTVDWLLSGTASDAADRLAATRLLSSVATVDQNFFNGGFDIQLPSEAPGLFNPDGREDIDEIAVDRTKARKDYILRLLLNKIGAPNANASSQALVKKLREASTGKSPGQ